MVTQRAVSGVLQLTNWHKTELERRLERCEEEMKATDRPFEVERSKVSPKCKRIPLEERRSELLNIHQNVEVQLANG